jgi:hypothetical protein
MKNNKKFTKDIFIDDCGILNLNVDRIPETDEEGDKMTSKKLKEVTTEIIHRCMIELDHKENRMLIRPMTLWEKIKGWLL